jgi:hypothetical protein
VFSESRGHRIITFEQANDRLAEGLTSSGRPAAIIPPRKPEARGGSEGVRV